VQRKEGAEIPLMEVELAHLDPSEVAFFSVTLTSAELDIATLTASNKWKGEAKRPLPLSNTKIYGADQEK
jgi:hypothetical protein